MKLKNLLITSILILPITSFADTNSCASFLTLGAYNIAQSGNDADALALKKSTFCAYDYSQLQPDSTQGNQIKAAYGLFSGGISPLNASEISATQARICTDKFGGDIYRSKASTPSQNIYQNAIDAWNSCQALSQKGVDLTLQPEPTMKSIGITLATNDGSQSSFNGLIQSGTGHSNCTAVIPPKNGSLNNKIIPIDPTTSRVFDTKNKLSINCNRQMVSDGKGDLSADAQTLTFYINGVGYPVPLGATGELSRVSVDKVMAGMEGSISSQFKKILPISCVKGNINASNNTLNVSDTISNIDLCNVNFLNNGLLFLDVDMNISGGGCVYFFSIDGTRVGGPAVTTINTGESGSMSTTMDISKGNHSFGIQLYSSNGSRQCSIMDIHANGFIIPKE